MDPAGDWRVHAGRFAAALQFFVRLPLPAPLAGLADHREGLNRAVPLFGPAGLAIGALAALVWSAAASLLPAALAAGLALAFAMWLTGALHEDGLADCADGLGGGRDRDRALEIMRDSRIGTFGASALVFSIGLRWAALAVLSAGSGALALMIAHSLGRAAIAIALRWSTYARSQGTGSLVAAGISFRELSITLGIALAVALVLGGLSGVLAALAGLGAAAALLLACERRIGGYTGDTLGAMEQAAEITVLTCLAGLWSLA